MEMKLGKVTGEVNVKRAAKGLEKARILQVELEGSTIAALDLAGAKQGDPVLVILGHAASRCSMELPADAVVTAVIQEN